MASNGPRIVAYSYSQGPATGASAAFDCTQTMAVIEEPSDPTVTYVRSTVPLHFIDELTTWDSLLDTHTPAGLYLVSYDATTGKVTIASTNATNFRPVMRGNCAEWSGFTQALAGFATTWTGASRATGIAELIGVTVEPAEDVARIDLAEYRHGRAVATTWGNHQVHACTLLFDAATKAQLEVGYLTTGRVRIWQFGDAAAYSPTNVDGYIDGFVIACGDATEEGDDGELWTLRMLVGVAR